MSSFSRLCLRLLLQTSLFSKIGYREQAEFFASRYRIDPSIYRIFVVPEVGRMSIHNIPFLLTHFEVGLRLPMEPAFADFLIFARFQFGQIHPNAIRTLFCLICLFCRLDFELLMNILRIFFSSLCMSNNTLSLRSRWNKIQQFD